MSLGQWTKAEAVLERALAGFRRGSRRLSAASVLAMYQLSHVYLEQNRTEEALETIVEAARTAGCNQAAASGAEEAEEAARGQFCVRIVTQEADVLREMGRYGKAAEVRGYKQTCC
jgi:tetratricopeptide (TPR) repeat protein